MLLKHPRIVIGTDDMYEHIYWGEEPFYSLLTVVPELYDRTVTINGCSKAYAMTGWRIGYCGGPKENHHRDGHDPGPVDVQRGQHEPENGGAAALAGDQTCVAEMNKTLQGAPRFHRRGD